MTKLTERRERMTITATSPDGNIKVILRRERQIRCEFRTADVFHQYGATDLAMQLSAMLCEMEEGRRRGVRQVYQASGWPVVDPDKPHWDAQRRRYREALREAEARGKSAQGLVLLKSTAVPDRYQVKVHPKAFEELDADGFWNEVYSAYADLRTDAQVKRNELRREYLPD